MEWERKTSQFEFAPYVSMNGRFRVQDINDCPVVKEYDELKKHNWDNKESHQRFIGYCRKQGIRLNGANWVLVDNETGAAIKFPFKTAKQAKDFAEIIWEGESPAEG